MDIYLTIIFGLLVILETISIIQRRKIKNQNKELDTAYKKLVEIKEKECLLIKENTEKMVWYSVNRELQK